MATTVRTLKAALRGNPHVTGVFAFGDGVLIELSPRMLQFWADNLGDRHGLVHFPPDQLLAEFLDFTPFTTTRVSFSYAPVTPGQ